MACSLAFSTLVLSPLKPRSQFPNPNPRFPPARLLLQPISASSSSSSPPETSCPVPSEQQPVNEYQFLAASLPFSWAAADLPDYCSRLISLGAAAALLVGLPVAAFGSRAIADPNVDGLRWSIAAVATGLLAVTLAVLRMYLGWAYVGNRLLSATVECVSGENPTCHLWNFYHYIIGAKIWVKTPEVLARDRLLGSFSVKPVLSRVKITLVGLAVSLVTCVLLFINIENTKNISENAGERIVAGVYNDASARSFEPEAFCGEPDLS